MRGAETQERAERDASALESAEPADPRPSRGAGASPPLGRSLPVEPRFPPYARARLEERALCFSRPGDPAAAAGDEDPCFPRPEPRTTP